MFIEKPFADINLVVQDEKIPAHRAFLIKNKYFQNLQTELMKDEISVPDISLKNFKGKISLSSSQSQLLLAILEFIYCDTVNLDEELAMELVGLADTFLLPKLKEACESYLSLNLRAENVLKISKRAEAVSAKKLEENVIAFLIKDFEKLSKTIELKSLSPELFVKLIMKLRK